MNIAGASIPANKPQLTLTVTAELNLFFIFKILKVVRTRKGALEVKGNYLRPRIEMTIHRSSGVMPRGLFV